MNTVVNMSQSNTEENFDKGVAISRVDAQKFAQATRFDRKVLLNEIYDKFEAELKAKDEEITALKQTVLKISGKLNACKELHSQCVEKSKAKG